LDAAPPPVRGAKLSRLPRGRADQDAWRRLLHPKARPLAIAQKKVRAFSPRPKRAMPRSAFAPSAPAQAALQESASMKEKNSRGFAIALTLTLLAIGTTGYLYQRDARVAGPIDQAANSFYAEASKLAALAP